MDYTKMTKQELIKYIETLPKQTEFDALKQKYETAKTAYTEVQALLTAKDEELNKYINAYNSELKNKEQNIKAIEAEANKQIQEKLKPISAIQDELEYTQGVLGSQVDLIRLLDKERQNNSETLTKMIAIYEKAILKIEE